MHNFIRFNLKKRRGLKVLRGAREWMMCTMKVDFRDIYFGGWEREGERLPLLI